MPKKGIVLNKGNVTEVDYSFLYAPSILKHNGHIWMYCTANDGTSSRIAMYCSLDGQNFKRKGVVVNLGSSGLVDDVAVFSNGNTFLFNNKIWFPYTCYDGTKYRCGLSVSNDGLIFIKKGIVVGLGSSGNIDAVNTYAPFFLPYNGKIYAYYQASGSFWRSALVFGISGMRLSNRKGVVIPTGTSGEVDDADNLRISILVYNNIFYAFYSTYDGATYRIGLACSRDGLVFKKKGIVTNIGTTGDVDDSIIYVPYAVSRNGNIIVIYVCAASTSDAATKIGMVIINDMRS